MKNTIYIKKIAIVTLACLGKIKFLAAKVSVEMLWVPIRLLPNEVLVGLRNKIQIIKRLDYPKANINLSVRSSSDLNVRLRSTAKEPETVKWLEENIGDNDVFYDIGANVGAYALIAASLNRTCKVVAIEPSCETYATLVNNVKINKLQAQVLPIYGAINSKTGFEKFVVSSQDSGAAEHPGLIPSGDGDVFLTPCFDLITLIMTFDIEPPTIIKIDVDGAEELVIRGCFEVIKSCDVKSILMELEQSSVKGKTIIKLLDDLGYAIHEKFPRGNPNHANIIFKRSTAGH